METYKKQKRQGCGATRRSSIHGEIEELEEVEEVEVIEVIEGMGEIEEIEAVELWTEQKKHKKVNNGRIRRTMGN